MSISSLRKRWASISIAQKLYFIVLLMTMMILLELVSLSFSLRSLSAVRAYVNGEGLWAKAQQVATFNLIEFGYTQDKKYYQKFLSSLSVNLGDKVARIELMKAKPDYARLRKGFIHGGNNPLDIEDMIKLYRRFRKVSFIKDTIAIWENADSKIAKLSLLGLKLRKIVSENS